MLAAAHLGRNACLALVQDLLLLLGRAVVARHVDAHPRFAVERIAQADIVVPHQRIHSRAAVEDQLGLVPLGQRMLGVDQHQVARRANVVLLQERLLRPERTMRERRRRRNERKLLTRLQAIEDREPPLPPKGKQCASQKQKKGEKKQKKTAPECPSLAAHMAKPPSTPRICPVMKEASGEARNSTAAATSSGRPKRQSGVSSARARLVSPSSAAQLTLGERRVCGDDHDD